MGFRLFSVTVFCRGPRDWFGVRDGRFRLTLLKSGLFLRGYGLLFGNARRRVPWLWRPLIVRLFIARSRGQLTLRRRGLTVPWLMVTRLVKPVFIVRCRRFTFITPFPRRWSLRLLLTLSVLSVRLPLPFSVLFRRPIKLVKRLFFSLEWPLTTWFWTRFLLFLPLLPLLSRESPSCSSQVTPPLGFRLKSKNS